MDQSQLNHNEQSTVVGGFLQTISGRTVSILNPQSDTIYIEDITHALSLLCRYGGHIPQFYSVAQHSLLVGHYLRRDNLALQGLLHDSAEAYLGDVISPLKPKLSGYSEIEDYMLQTIFFALDVPWPTDEEWARIKEVDQRVLGTEVASMMNQGQYPDGLITYEPYDTSEFTALWQPMDPAGAANAFATAYSLYRN